MHVLYTHVILLLAFINKHELNEVIQLFNSEEFSSEASLLSDQQLLPHQVRERERREAQNIIPNTAMNANCSSLQQYCFLESRIYQQQQYFLKVNCYYQDSCVFKVATTAHCGIN